MRFAKSFEDKRRICLKRPTYHSSHSNHLRIRRLDRKVDNTEATSRLFGQYNAIFNMALSISGGILLS